MKNRVKVEQKCMKNSNDTDACYSRCGGDDRLNCKVFASMMKKRLKNNRRK